MQQNLKKPELLLIRKLTRGRKIVIGILSVLLLIILGTTAAATIAFLRGSEWYVAVNLRVFTDTHLDSQLHQFEIPVMNWWRYVGCTLTVWVGFKWLKAILIPPVVGTRPVDMAAFGGPSDDMFSSKP